MQNAYQGIRLSDQSPVSSYAGMTDSELIAACQNRDQKAFQHLMNKYDHLIKAWISHAAPDWLDRSDLAQEVLIKVWRSIGGLRRSDAFKVWLHHVVTNIVYDHLRYRTRSQVISIDSPAAEGEEQSLEKHISDVSRIPDRLYEQRELDCAIRKAIARLPDEFRLAVVLREMGGLAYADIAKLTNTGVGTVKSRIARARKKVQILLRPYLNAA